MRKSGVLADPESSVEGRPVAGSEPLGLYISVPFCRGKCTFCNFASGVHPESLHPAYVRRLIDDMRQARSWAEASGLLLPERVDTVYLGGGTPTILAPSLIKALFAAVRQEFAVDPGAEITMEAAPGQLPDDVLTSALASGVNRFSFGVQSFINTEARAVGRSHTREIALADLARAQAARASVGVDLIAGLPGQTAASWRESLDVLCAARVDHASIYMLEVDEESRLGQEMLLGGVRYGAPAAPSDDATAEMYLGACERLADAGLAQYEISNFAAEGRQGRHNRKYWRRRPYLGLGLDASSMLRDGAGRAVRFTTADQLEAYLEARGQPALDRLDRVAEQEEAWFLGLRMNSGVDLDEFAAEFGADALERAGPLIEELLRDGLLERVSSRLDVPRGTKGETAPLGAVALTPRGRLVSNELFSRFLEPEPVLSI